MKAEDYQGDDPDVEKVSAGPLRLLLHWAGSAIRQRRSSSEVSRAFRQPRNWRILGSDTACNNCDCFPLQVRRRIDYDLGLGVYSSSRVRSVGRSSSSGWW